MAETPVIHVLNGPNLNLLGVREPHIYGRETLADIEQRCVKAAGGAEIVFRQTNHEGVLVDWIQEARESAHALVLNPAAYGHTSVALHDALKTLTIPVIELHLSNPAAREAFRHHSYVSSAATGVIAGFGANGYELAVQAALDLIRERP
ncbi:type II 3-dehydroquinate dehydratase [Brevundimonas sp.]|uniref:type II 3-dehydroquinate dehydratase n=1 Tax=Brevundimonas sp. TaxID=1871086 RepID=UPI001ACD5BDA|nr:type II 3-dehydroquinate dehydratase [Brevundimonas sp.]MBN9464541.1 type II 3-dehydroquinate dehydratase [Brevundimonas sp.]